MLTPQQITDIKDALLRAGSEQLPGPAKAYLTDRMLRDGGIDVGRCNLGGLRSALPVVIAGGHWVATPGGGNKWVDDATAKGDLFNQPGSTGQPVGKKPKLGVRARLKKLLGKRYISGTVKGTVVTISTHPLTPQLRAQIPKKVGKYRIVVKERALNPGQQAQAQRGQAQRGGRGLSAYPTQQELDQQQEAAYQQGAQEAQQQLEQQLAEEQGQQAPQQWADEGTQQDGPMYDPQAEAWGDDSGGAEVDDGSAEDWEMVAGIGAAPGPSGLAVFADLDEGARALVATSYRAAPRAWGDVGEAEIRALGRYPLERLQPALGAVAAAEDAPPIGWWPGFGPSPEAEQTYRALTADWEGFDRAGVGQRILPHLRQDVIEWREFRDHWKAGDIDSSNINGALMAETARARRIRTELRDAKVIDPALGPGRDIQAPGVEHSGGGLSFASAIDHWATGVPFLSAITAPTSALGKLGVTPSGALAGAGLLALLLWYVSTRGGGGRSAVTVVVPQAKA